MTLKTCGIAFITLTTCIAPCFSQQFNQATISNLNSIIPIIQHDGYDTSHTLVVFDLDDTLLTMPTALGSTGWWDWQSALLGTNDPQAVADNRDDLLRIQATLYRLSDMKHTQPDISSLLNWLHVNKIPSMVLTSRGEEYDRLTQQQMDDAHLSTFFGDNGLTVNANSISNNENTSVAGDFIPCDSGFDRAASYEKGVYYGSGQNKGQMLQCFLNNQASEANIQAVYFVDDTQSNLADMTAAMNEAQISGTAFWFNRYIQYHEFVQNNQAIHDHMTIQWNDLKQQIHAAFKSHAAI